MKRFSLFLISILALISMAYAEQPPAANLVMARALGQAKHENKNVLVIFHASWCGWCKKLDAFLEDKEMGGLMNSGFVIVHIDVLEQKDKKDLENAGGEDLMKSWNGDQAGLPFTVVLDSSGKKLADSNLKDKPDSNIGYPAKPEEIAHFMKMLKSAPNLNDENRGKIEGWLKEHAPKAG